MSRWGRTRRGRLAGLPRLVFLPIRRSRAPCHSLVIVTKVWPSRHEPRLALADAMMGADTEAPPPDAPTILIVEDNAVVRDYLKSHLAGRYRIEEAASPYAFHNVDYRTGF